jgi:hypothetical protein
MIAGLRTVAVVDGDEVPGVAVRGAAGGPRGLDDAAGGVGRDGLVLELADGEDGTLRLRRLLWPGLLWG